MECMGDMGVVPQLLQNGKLTIGHLSFVVSPQLTYGFLSTRRTFATTPRRFTRSPFPGLRALRTPLSNCYTRLGTLQWA